MQKKIQKYQAINSQLKMNDIQNIHKDPPQEFDSHIYVRNFTALVSIFFLLLDGNPTITIM